MTEWIEPAMLLMPAAKKLAEFFQSRRTTVMKITVAVGLIVLVGGAIALNYLLLKYLW